ncbi:MAG: uracil-DNA glycosylase [Bacilli bacterium]
MINKNWDLVLKEEYKKDYFKKLLIFVDNAYKNNVCFPKFENIFKALKETDYNSVKVVILGQDPYHGVGQAQGLSFSVSNTTKRPPSLNNILKELETDLGIVKKTNDLTSWAKQGILLLNCIMTVEKDKPLSHKNNGWEIFTDTIISKLNASDCPIVFILWGSYAQSKRFLITNPSHYVIEAAHPSPLSAYRGFFGSKPFSKTNSFLMSKNRKPIAFEK